MKYSGFYFDSENEIKKRECSVEFHPQQLKIYPKNSNTLVWDIAKLECFIGGSNDHLYYFHKQGSKDPSFYLHRSKELDQNLLKIPYPKINSVVKQAKNKNLMRWSLPLGALSLVILLFFSIYKMRSPIVDFVVSKIPYETEKELGTKLFDHMKPSLNLIDDKATLEAYRDLTKDLVEDLPEEFRDIKFYISRDETVNAFAVPGGSVVFYKGALSRFKDYSEFAGVLAHEISHIKKRHSLKNLVSALSTYVLISLLVGDVGGIIAVLSEQGSVLLSRSFSRDFEQEADDEAFDLLVSNEIDPRGLAGFFETLKAEQSKALKDLEGKLEFLSTHPATDSRIENINKKYSEFTNSNPSIELKKNKLAFKKWQAKYFPLGEEE